MSIVVNNKSRTFIADVIGKHINSPEQRLIQGATALFMQPVIDYFNHSADDETRAVSVARTIGKIIAGTCVGVAVRYGAIYCAKNFANYTVTKIENNDFSSLIDYAEKSNGFEHDHLITEVKVGYREEEIMEKINNLTERIKNKEIKHLLVVGLLNHTAGHSSYFSELEKNLPEDFFVISTIMPSTKKNILYFDSFFNSSLIYKILAHIKTQTDFEKFPVSVFITTCNLHTLSHIFNLKYLGIKNIFLPECGSNTITPQMAKFLKTKFGFKQVSQKPENDLSAINS